jgi:hypothetical protein
VQIAAAFRWSFCQLSGVTDARCIGHTLTGPDAKGNAPDGGHKLSHITLQLHDSLPIHLRIFPVAGQVQNEF